MWRTDHQANVTSCIDIGPGVMYTMHLLYCLMRHCTGDMTDHRYNYRIGVVGHGQTENFKTNKVLVR